MRGRIRAATWMSQATKAEAYKKLDTMRSKVGYPDKWRDYGKLDIARRPYVLNVLAANAFEFRRELAKLGKPVDRDEWNMTPQTNNAYYEPTLNEMCFPAGILQPPFFDEKADDATNYGAIGATIGHELTHGFDDQGRQYDSARQPEELVDRRRRQGLSRAGRARGAAVRRLRGAARTAHQRPSDARRKHRRHRRTARVPTRPSSWRPRARSWRRSTVSRRTSDSSSPSPRAGEPTSVPRRCVCTWAATCTAPSAGGCSDRSPISPSFARRSAARNRRRAGRRSGSGRREATPAQDADTKDGYRGQSGECDGEDRPKVQSHRRQMPIGSALASLTAVRADGPLPSYAMGCVTKGVVFRHVSENR